MLKFMSKLGLTLFLGLLLIGHAQAGSYHNLVVLGDSLSDSGNIYLATNMTIPGPGEAYFMGRFSNGPNYADQLADALGITLVPSLAGGTNFAFGGARTDSPRTGILAQLQYLLYSGIPLTEETLVILFAGGNNLRDGLFAALSAPQNSERIFALTVQGAVADLIYVVQQLRMAGANNIVLPNMPNLALTPEIQELSAAIPGLAGMAELLSSQFNRALKTALVHLDSEDIVRFNTFAFVQRLVKNPKKFNLTNVHERCYTGDSIDFTGGGSICPNPEEYLFWDGIHPTTATYRLLAEALRRKLQNEE